MVLLCAADASWLWLEIVPRGHVPARDEKIRKQADKQCHCFSNAFVVSVSNEQEGEYRSKPTHHLSTNYFYSASCLIVLIQLSFSTRGSIIFGPTGERNK